MDYPIQTNTFISAYSIYDNSFLLKINRLIAGTLAFVLIAGIGNQAFADLEGLGDDYDDSITLPNNAPQVAPIVDCNVDSGDVVAFETSRGQSTSNMALWESDLQANGFVVREFDITTQGIPDCIVKMVIKSTIPVAGCLTSTYTAAESTQIANWVNDGGALLLLNDNAACGPATHPVTTALGETANVFNISTIFNSATNWDPTNPSTLWNGVSNWNYFSGSDYQPSVDSVATDGVFPMGDPIVISKEIGDGCALIMGESDWTSDPLIVSNDNQQLALNTLLFLNECIEPDKVVGGEFLPIDSTALLLAGLQTSAIWMLPILAGAAGVGAFYIKTRMNKNN